MRELLVLFLDFIELGNVMLQRFGFTRGQRGLVAQFGVVGFERNDLVLEFFEPLEPRLLLSALPTPAGGRPAGWPDDFGNFWVENNPLYISGLTQDHNLLEMNTYTRGARTPLEGSDCWCPS